MVIPISVAGGMACSCCEWLLLRPNASSLSEPTEGITLSWMKHPLTRNLEVDDPETTRRRRAIIRQKRFLFKLYTEWYACIRDAVPSGNEKVVELGSGAGFFKEIMPEAITTEVLALEGIDVRLPADGGLPFEDRSLRAIVMTDVLHHLRFPRRFFHEASRCVRPGGTVVMIEPWVTKWSRFIYSRFHDEPFLPESQTWELPHKGPLSGANGALPWMIFKRDRERFETEFPEWQVDKIQPMMPFAYLLSGGVSMPAFCPGCFYGLWRAVERALGPIERSMAMFALIVLVRS